MADLCEGGNEPSGSLKPIWIGYAICLMDIYMGMYYNTIIGWAVYYLLASFTYELPWTTCGNPWNTNDCAQNMSARSNKSTSPAKEFFEKKRKGEEKRRGREGTKARGHRGTRARGHGGMRAWGHEGTGARGHKGTGARGHGGTGSRGREERIFS
ncbi:hypothetical protein ANN_12213 [Periplaneta americana]|uniref:Uncharacterized protein n=1 Tax=Periplaneta americana TaxID=6978 RepID=A0ABQ8TI28_PERAM|nr:hypothetical protein ANN_12213 [Periplaneta americana]